jgi:MFS family permease
VGTLADRVGNRRVLAGCLVGFGTTGTLVAFAPEFRIVIALRFLQGVTAGTIVSALAMTVAGDRYDGRRRASVIGLVAAAVSVGSATYPILGGYLSALRWNLPFLLYVVPVIVGGVVLFGLEERSADATGTPTLRATLRALPTRRSVQVFGLMVLTFTLVFGAVFTLVPLFLHRGHGLAAAEIGVATSLLLLVTAVVSTANGHLAGIARSRTLVGVGYGCYSLGLLAVATAEGLAVVLAGLVTFGLGSGLVVPTLYAGVSRVAPEQFRASATALQTTMIGTGQALGPALFTAGAALVGAGAVLLASSVAAVVGSIAVLGVVRIDPAG